MAHLWHSTGNPLFPYFNEVFLSPWSAPDPYRDPGFLQHGLWADLTFGFRFPFDSSLTAEVQFRDFRIMALLVVVPLAALTGLVRMLGSGDSQLIPFTRPGPSRWLLAAAAGTYEIGRAHV